MTVFRVVLPVIAACAVVTGCRDADPSQETYADARMDKSDPIVVDAFARFSNDVSQRVSPAELMASGINASKYDCLLILPTSKARFRWPHNAGNFVYCYDKYTGEFRMRL